MSANGVLRIREGNLLAFWCEGCKTSHVVSTGWIFNGNYERPTFSPSVLVRTGHYIKGHKGPCWCSHDPSKGYPKCSVCHSFVTDGKIQFLSDCTHHLAGQTIDLKPF